MKGGFPSDNENVQESNESSTLTAQSVYAKNRDIFENPKKMIFEKKENDKDKLLDEEQIKDLDN